MTFLYRDGTSRGDKSRGNDEATTDMANNPQKSKDATEEALSAIQEALNVRAPDTPTGASFGPVAETAVVSPSAEATDLFPRETPAPGWPTSDPAPRRAANDDRVGTGQILQALRYRPARAPYFAAGIGGFIWVAGGIALTSLYGAEIRSVFATPGVGLAAMVALATAIIVPVILIVQAGYIDSPRPRHDHGAMRTSAIWGGSALRS